MNKQVENLLFMTWGISVIAIAGSLFFSEIMGFIPCDLCWYQRILMYPLSILYGIAYLKKDCKYCYAGIILSGLGLCTALFHYLTQTFTIFNSANEKFCGTVPCTTKFFNFLGFITIPFLSFIAFVFILIFHVLILIKQKEATTQQV